MKHTNKLIVIIDILVKYAKGSEELLEASNGNILKVQRLIVATSVAKRETPHKWKKI